MSHLVFTNVLARVESLIQRLHALFPDLNIESVVNAYLAEGD